MQVLQLPYNLRLMLEQWNEGLIGEGNSTGQCVLLRQVVGEVCNLADCRELVLLSLQFCQIDQQNILMSMHHILSLKGLLGMFYHYFQILFWLILLLHHT